MSSSVPNFDSASAGLPARSIPLLNTLGMPSTDLNSRSWRNYFSSGDRALSDGNLGGSQLSFAAALEAAEVYFLPHDFARIVTVKKLSSLYARLGDQHRADAVISEASHALHSSVAVPHPAYLLLDVARADNARLRGDFSTFRPITDFFYEHVATELTRGATLEPQCFTEFFLPAAQCVFQSRIEGNAVESARKLIVMARRLANIVAPKENEVSGVLDLMEAKVNVASKEVTADTLDSVQRAVKSFHYAPGKFSLELYEAHVCGVIAALEVGNEVRAQEYLAGARAILARGGLEAITPLHRLFLLRAEESYALSKSRPHYAAQVLREHADLLRKHAPEAIDARREKLSDLEGAYRRLGKKQELAYTQNEVLGLVHRALGEESQAFAEALWSRAISRLSEGAPSDARKLLAWAWEIAGGMQDVSPQLAAGVCVSFAKATSLSGTPAEALDILKQTDEIVNFDIESHRHIHCMRELVKARALIKLGSRGEAAIHLENLVAEMPRVPDDWNGREAVRVLAGLKIADGKPEEAERLLLPFRGHKAFHEPMTSLILAMALLHQNDPDKIEDGHILARLWLNESQERIAQDLRSLGHDVAESILPTLLLKNSCSPGGVLVAWLEGG